VKASGKESPFFFTCRKEEASNGYNSEGDLSFFSVYSFLAMNVTYLGLFDTHRQMHSED